MVIIKVERNSTASTIYIDFPGHHKGVVLHYLKQINKKKKKHVLCYSIITIWYWAINRNREI